MLSRESTVKTLRQLASLFPNWEDGKRIITCFKYGDTWDQMVANLSFAQGGDSTHSNGGVQSDHLRLKTLRKHSPPNHRVINL